MGGSRSHSWVPDLRSLRSFVRDTRYAALARPGHAASQPAQAIDQLHRRIGIRRHAELQLRLAHRGAGGQAELAVELARHVAPPRQQLLQLQHLLGAERHHGAAAAMDRRLAGKSGR